MLKHEGNMILDGEEEFKNFSQKNPENIVFFFCFYQIIAFSDCFLSSSVLILLLFLRGIFQNIHKASWPLFLVEKQLPSCLQLQLLLSSPSSWIRHCSSCCRHCNHLPRRHSSFYRWCEKNVGLTNVDLTNVDLTNIAILHPINIVLIHVRWVITSQIQNNCCPNFNRFGNLNLCLKTKNVLGSSKAI